jgi:hypothetical protein
MIAPVPTSPAAWYLRILWNARLPFLLIVAACAGVAAGITALQTPLYASRALMSVRPPPEVVAEFLRTHRPARMGACTTRTIRCGKADPAAGRRGSPRRAS